MSTLELENIKHADASSNAIELASNGNLEVTGIVTKPGHPVFAARLSASHSQPSGVNLFGGTWTTKTNNGSYYNATNRRFTAPVDGWYAFNCIVATIGGTGSFSYLSAELWINGARTMIGAWEGSASTSYSGTSASFVQYMNANDYAELGCESDKAFTAQATTHGSTMFSGYLIG